MNTTRRNRVLGKLNLFFVSFLLSLFFSTLLHCSSFTASLLHPVPLLLLCLIHSFSSFHLPSFHYHAAFLYFFHSFPRILFHRLISRVPSPCLAVIPLLFLSFTVLLLLSLLHCISPSLCLSFIVSLLHRTPPSLCPSHSSLLFNASECCLVTAFEVERTQKWRKPVLTNVHYLLTAFSSYISLSACLSPISFRFPSSSSSIEFSETSNNLTRTEKKERNKIREK